LIFKIFRAIYFAREGDLQYKKPIDVERAYIVIAAENNKESTRGRRRKQQTFFRESVRIQQAAALSFVANLVLGCLTYVWLVSRRSTKG
jgi:hypothetical protein